MTTLNFDIIGRDRGATKLLKDVGTQAGVAQKGFAAMQQAAGQAGGLVEQAAKRMAAAERKAADAAGAARVAHAKLQELRKRGTASAAQMVKAEEAVAKADRNLVAAQKQVASSADAVKKATAAESASLQKLDKDASKATGSVDHLSNRAGLLGAGLLAGVGVVLKSAAGFDKAMSSVAATGRDASQNIEGLRKEAIKMGAATKFSATEAAQGIENLLKAGVSTSDVLNGGLRGALDLAAAGSLEVADAAEIAATAMTQFGLSGAQIPHVADLLAAGAGKAQGEVKDIGDALKMAGLVASQFGISIEETTGTLAAFASAGLLGSDAGTSFKQMLLQLSAPSGVAAGLMEELGIAAYDANGSFVGLSNLAGQLRDKLGPLTQAQRDNALATIFGSDATRAANVLFKEGAGGISNWTDKVNDAGYAAQVARTKMDNLAGDLETLKGSIETTFIVAGTGANEALRGLTQEATRAVNAIGQMPAPVLQTGVKLTALTGIGLLAFAGISKLTVGMSESRQAMAHLSEEAPRLAKGLSVASKAVGAATAAFAAMQIAGAVANEINGKFVPSVDNAAGALIRLATAKNAGNIGDLDKFFAISDDTVNSIDSVGEALSRATDPKFTDRLGSFIDSIAGTQQTLTKTQLNIEALDKVLLSLDTETAADGFRRIAMQAQASGVPIEELVNLFPQYAQKVRDAGNATGHTFTSQKELADMMMNGVAPASLEAAQGLAKTANKSGMLTSEVKLAKKQLKEMTEALFGSARAALELEGSEDGVQAAIDDATKSVKTNGKTLDNNTEKGRNNRAALRALAESSIAYREKLIEQGKSQKTVTNTTQESRREFVATAIKMGVSRKKAEELADSFGLLDRKIRTISSKHVKIKFSSNASSVLRGFHVNLTAPSSAGRLARGGPVSGPGTSTSDSIPTMLSKGEFVVNAKQTARHRELLEAINAGRAPTPHLARGGYVNVDVGKFPPGAMQIPGAASAAASAYGRKTGQTYGKAFKKAFNDAFGSFGGPGGGITGAAGGRVHYKGGTFTKLFARNLELVERAAHTSMRIFQGGFRPRTSYSGTSHAGDAVDFQVNYGLGRAFRKYVGAAGDRTGLGHWAGHIHAVPSPRTGRAGGSAIWQYKDYVRRGGARQSMRSPWGLSTGGLVTRPSDIRAGEFGPERMLSVPQTRNFDRLVRVMDRSGGAANTYITVNAPHYVGDKNDLVKALVDLKRQSRLSVVLR